MGPGDLQDLIDSLCIETNEQVIVGPGDDAAVFKINNLSIIQTVDFITPVVNDPFSYGAISACNSLSDIYAMGGIPLTALAIVGFSVCDLGAEVLKLTLHGALSILNSAGTVLIGGHCIDDKEMKFGLAVTGVTRNHKILTVGGAQEGNLLILTKPIGVGVITTALKGGKLTDEETEVAKKWMMTLNEEASIRALKAGATACTDVTGFGLLGHAYNMVKGSNLDILIDYQKVPVLDRVFDLIDRGMVALGAYNNLSYLEGKVQYDEDLTTEHRLVLADPQTSGGLLIALPEGSLGHFDGIYHRVIGRFIKGSGRIFVQNC